MLNSTAVDLPLMRSAVLVSQFLQLYLKKELASYIKSLFLTPNQNSNRTKIVLPRVLSLLRHHSKETDLTQLTHGCILFTVGSNNSCLFAALRRLERVPEPVFAVLHHPGRDGS